MANSINFVYRLLDSLFVALIEAQQILNVFIFGFVSESNAFIDSLFGHFL